MIYMKNFNKIWRKKYKNLKKNVIFAFKKFSYRISIGIESCMQFKVPDKKIYTFWGA